jgi:hypothetical protein
MELFIYFVIWKNIHDMANTVNPFCSCITILKTVDYGNMIAKTNAQKLYSSSNGDKK